MSQRREAMGPGVGSEIAEQAEVELWESLRSEIRRRLLVTVSVGAFYLLIASVVGMFLIRTLATMNDDAELLLTWTSDVLNTSTMNPILWAYVCFAVAVIFAYGVAMLLIAGYLPANLCAIVGSLPWIGSTMRMVSMGEFCQSIYQSVLAVKSYAEAFEAASKSVRNADLRRWLAISAKRIEHGYPIENVLMTSPIRDQPLTSATAFIAEERSAGEVALIWRRASAECHLLAQSRLNRAVLMISSTSLLVSALLATIAMFLSITFMSQILEGLAY